MSFLSSPGLTSVPTQSVINGPSDFAQPLASDMIGKTQALANAPMPAYTGQLTAGASDLQNQAWQGLSNLTLPSGFGTAQQNLGDISTRAMGTSYSPNAPQPYMNPYLQMSLDPQLAEARRQSAITGTQIASGATGKGAFGGNREALMQSENQRNLGTNLANITGAGYNKAYDTAVQQAEFGSNLGLQGLTAATGANQALSQSATNQNQQNVANLQAQATGGAQQRQVEQDALNAQYNQYLLQLGYPAQMLGLERSAIGSLPGSSSQSTYGAAPSGIQQASGVLSGLGSLFGNTGSLNGVANSAGSGIASLLSGIFGSNNTTNGTPALSPYDAAMGVNFTAPGTYG